MRKVSEPTKRLCLSAEELTRLEARVQHQLSGQLRGFRLKYDRLGLVLQGRVTSYYARQSAEQEVLMLTGLPTVRNEIDVI